METELVETDGEVVQPGPALEELLDDEDLVDIWVELLAVTLGHVLESSGMSEALVPTLMMLYVDPASIPVPDLAAAAAAARHDVDVADTVPEQVGAVAPAVDEFVRSLVELDAAVEDDSGRVRLTALGRYGVNRWLDAVGVEAPAVADLADASVAELIGLGYAANGPDELDALFDEWTSARGAEAAAHDLVEYADFEADAHSRMTAFSLLDRIGPPAEPAVRRGLDSTVTRAHARAWLHGRSLEVAEPELADVQWLFVDAVVSSLDDDTDMVRKAMSETGLSAQEHAEMIAELWRCGHPQATEALDAFSRHHPDRAVAEAARTAAVEARSAVLAPAPRRTEAAKKSTPKSAKARAKAKTAQAKAARAATACQLKITLMDVKPAVWRRITVPATVTLPDLHDAIQAAMGWTDSHLHEFDIDGRQYSVPDADGESDVLPEAGVRLLDLVGAGGRFGYVYDFGEGWRHDVQVENVLPPGTEVPACLSGRRRCPPEDVGGPWGYAGFLEAYGDPAHADHEHLREWAGASFDPDQFDAGEVTVALRRLFR